MREQFLLDPELAQFAAFVLSPHTAPLQAAIDGYRDELAVDTEAALLTGIEREAAVRSAAAAYAGGTADQFALTDSTTMGIASMYGGLSLAPGDEVLTTTHDFYSTEASLDLLAGRTGAEVRRVTLYDDPATADRGRDGRQAGRRARPRTRVVAVTWVHSSTGVRLPIQEMGAAIADAGRERGERVLFCVDGVHGFGAVDVDLPDLGCDFLATGTHKWLFGPRGTGILWGRDWSPLTELIPTFSGPGRGGERLTPGGYQAFEHQWAAADAFALMEQIGRDRVAARTTEQATQLKEALAEVDGVRVVTPAAPRSPPASCASTCRPSRRATRCSSCATAGSSPALRRTPCPTCGSGRASRPRPSRSTPPSQRWPGWCEAHGLRPGWPCCAGWRRGCR